MNTKARNSVKLIKTAKVATMAIGAVLALAGAVVPAASAAEISYHQVDVDGVRIAYREAGDPRRPALLLLHGVPSSSRMYERLMRELGDRYHLVAPDYPGFGNSAAPDPTQFVYSFDQLAKVVEKFTDQVGLNRYTLFMQDYGAPVGMRLAGARSQAIQALIFQNGNVYEEGLGPVWESRKLYWQDRPALEAKVLAAHQSVAVTRARHVGLDPNVTAYDPDAWMDEWAYLNRPEQARIQTELIYDYRNNLVRYPEWQAWLRQRQLPTLVVWGKYDQAFLTPGALAFKRDNPAAQVHVLDGGHFVMDTRLKEVAALTARFMDSQATPPAPRP